MPDNVYGLLFLIALFVLVVLFGCCFCYCCDVEDVDGRANRPAESSAEQRVDPPPAPPAESAEQRVARAWAEREALAARAEAALAARAHAALTGKAAAPPVPLPLPYFPYAAADQGGKPPPSETTTVECAICLEPLRPGQLCSEVPPCRHVFHRDCLGEWARSNGSCPLCRAKIVPGSDEIAIADDMV